MTELDSLQRKQLDQKLAPLRTADLRSVPRGGWTRAIRTALGMSVTALGRRIGVSQSAVSQLESGEEQETITLASLRKLAGGLDCDLVYALVPRGSLDEIMRRQAEMRASSIVGAVSTTMELEDQAVSEQERRSQLEALARDLLMRPNTGLWDDS